MVRFDRRVVICGSMSFTREIQEIAHLLDLQGVAAVVPQEIDLPLEYGSQEAYAEYKRTVSRAHISKVRDPRTTGVLVANFDKRGQAGYIGPNTFAEIAIAFADGKRIFLMNRVPRTYEDELLAWGAQELYGDLGVVSRQFHEACPLHEGVQLKFPWS